MHLPQVVGNLYAAPCFNPSLVTKSEPSSNLAG
jgi:hypothetical protein